MNSLYSLLDARYIYIFTLKFSDLSVFKSSFNLMFDIFKDIDIKVFSKLIDNNIRSIIIILCSIFTILTFF